MKVIGRDERGCPIWKDDDWKENKTKPKEVKAIKIEPKKKSQDKKK